MLQHSSGVSSAVTHSLRTALAGAVAVTGPCCLGPTHTLTQVLSSLLGLDSVAGQPRRRSSVPFGHARGLCQCTCGSCRRSGRWQGWKLFAYPGSRQVTTGDCHTMPVASLGFPSRSKALGELIQDPPWPGTGWEGGVLTSEHVSEAERRGLPPTRHTESGLVAGGALSARRIASRPLRGDGRLPAHFTQLYPTKAAGTPSRVP